MSIWKVFTLHTLLIIWPAYWLLLAAVTNYYRLNGLAQACSIFLFWRPEVWNRSTELLSLKQFQWRIHFLLYSSFQNTSISLGLWPLPVSSEPALSNFVSPYLSATSSPCLTFPCCSGEAQGRSVSWSCVHDLGNFQDLFLTFQPTVNEYCAFIWKCKTFSINCNEYLVRHFAKKKECFAYLHFLFWFILKVLYLKSGLLNGPPIFYRFVISYILGAFFNFIFFYIF